MTTPTITWFSLLAMLLIAALFISAGVIFAQMLRGRRKDPDAPLAYGFPVEAESAAGPRPVQTLGNDGPGRYRVVGVIAATGADTKMHVDAASLANAKVKAELKGVVVTDVVKE